MKIVSAALALGFSASLATAAFADCPGHTASKDKPLTTASSTVKTDDKG